jgi:hypothetical protein
MNRETLFLMSMEELSKLAKNPDAPKMLRREALQVLHSREQWLYERHLRSGKVSKVYVPDLQ